MKRLLLIILIAALFTSCAASYCPSEKAGKSGKVKDKNLNRKVAGL